MRLGRNDRKIQSPVQAARVTAAVVTYVPEEFGYFQDRLEVIKLSLASLVKHADLPMDLMVFDNASCAAVGDCLRSLKDQGIIKYLILSSKNVGLAGAYRIIAGAAPGEMVAFANDDVFYFPNWLSPQVEVLDQYPDVGLVSGFYLRGTHPRTAQLAAEKGLEVRVVVAPGQWMDEFCRDASYESHEAYYRAQEAQGWTDLRDMLITSNGVSAYAGGVCWQAVYRKEVMGQLLPRDDPQQHGFRSYDGYLHAEIIHRGYLRLSTAHRLVRHMGNVVTAEIADLAAQLGIDAGSTVSEDTVGSRNCGLMKFGLMRKGVSRLGNYLYRLANS